MDGPTPLQYGLTEEDVWAFAVSHLGRHRLSRWSYFWRHLSRYPLFFLVLILVGRAVNPPWLVPIFGYAGLAVIVVAVLFYPQFLRGSARSRVRKVFADPLHVTKISSYSVQVRPEGVFYRDGVQEGRLDWKGIREVVETPAYLFLYTEPADALIIPRRASPDDSSWHELVHAARKYQERAVSSATPCPPDLLQRTT